MYVYVCMCGYVCMYSCVCICMYVYIYVCVSVCTYVYVCMYVWVCMYMSMYVCTCIYIYICVRLCTYVYVCMYVSTSMYVCIYVCVGMYVCTMYICISVCVCIYVSLYKYICIRIMYIYIHNTYMHVYVLCILYACVHTYLLLTLFSSAILQHTNYPVSHLITIAQYGFTKSLQRRMPKAHSSRQKPKAVCMKLSALFMVYHNHNLQRTSLS